MYAEKKDIELMLKSSKGNEVTINLKKKQNKEIRRRFVNKDGKRQLNPEKRPATACQRIKENRDHF